MNAPGQAEITFPHTSPENCAGGAPGALVIFGG
jgi:hypothetical protein